MNHNLKKPCPYCPFMRGSAQGWLGGFTAHQYASLASGESPLACHHTSDLIREANPEADEFEISLLIDAEGEQCAGALAFANRIGKLYRNPVLGKHADELGKVEGVMGLREFLDYHAGAGDGP